MNWENILSSNEDMIAEMKAYFRSVDKYFYRKDTDKSEGSPRIHVLVLKVTSGNGNLWERGGTSD